MYTIDGTEGRYHIKRCDETVNPLSLFDPEFYEPVIARLGAKRGECD